MPQNVLDKLKFVTPAMAFSKTQLYWPLWGWHLKETHLDVSMELLQQIQFKLLINIPGNTLQRGKKPV